MRRPIWFAAAVLTATIAALQIPATSGADLPAAATREVDFGRDVRPIFASACLGCHGPEKSKGGLRLDRKADAMRGGGDGPAIAPGDGAGSLLMQLVAGLEADRTMPPKGSRLTSEQVGVIRAWIDQGADWPDDSDATAEADPRDWWSLRPLARPVPPVPRPEDAGRVRNPVDAFVLAKVREQGLIPSSEADRRTLIRRLSFDLIGLPPTPEEFDAFEADPAPDAYERLVDRLLASPAHGERWARHWLDLVHYGDTHGYDKDQPRPNAWPYRDYVIRAFNDDKPYARFVQEQVAGDVLFPGTVDGVVALGFIAAGPWDLIGHAEVPETKVDGKIARHLDRDDMVATTLNTFASLTAQCAQCHDHKFDPVRQEDYYRLQAVFAALDRADRPYHADPATARKAGDLHAARAGLIARRDAITGQIPRDLPDGPRPEFGYHSVIEPAADRAKWVQVELPQSARIDRAVLWGAHDDFNAIGDGFGFPARFKVEASDDPDFRIGVSMVDDRTGADQPNPGIAPVKIHANGAMGRYVRVTATRLAPRQGDFSFALAELEVLDSSGANLAAEAPVRSLDSIEAGPRWSRANLSDGHAPGLDGPGSARSRAARRSAVVAAAGEEVARDLDRIEVEMAAVDAQLAKVLPAGSVYAGTIHRGSGAFRGTGADGGQPRTIRILRRGDVKTPGKEVGPGAPDLFAELSGYFDLPADHAEGERRAALARWLTDRRNPLVWRSIVNRIWQHHFGRGIAANASDFGRMGQPPSHPELLDWLAAGFRDGGQSLKALHRLMVTSATYRQVSTSDEMLARRDAGNVYLARMSRRKLEAEAIRDAALAAAGTLDRAMYGPAFRDFKVDRPEHSPHYDYRAADPDDPRIRRRSIYRFLVRSKPQPFMAALDCADPSMQVDKRSETLSPLQALALYNDAFMLVAAKHLAARVEGEPDPITAAFRLAIGRPPTPVERDSLARHTCDHGAANACRVILNLNEFVFVD